MISEEIEAAEFRRMPFVFKGKTMEYFGIWVMNVLLTVLTLGIYYAWAKVRTKRYFYGNTFLDNTPFDFLADPITILKGWSIGIVAFILYSVIVELYPMTFPLFLIIFIIGLPWVIVKAMAFRARNSSYRNLRFHFNRDYKEALKVFILNGMLVPLTLGLMIPYYIFRQKKFIIDNNNYGRTAFSMETPVGEFYKIYFLVLVCLIGLGFLLVAPLPWLASLFGDVAPTIGESFSKVAEADPEDPRYSLLGLYPVLFFLIAFLLISGYLQAAVNNAIWNHTLLGKHRFESRLKAGKMIFLYFTNSLAIMLSFGLLIPWARIRMSRYRFSCILLLAADDLASFIAAEQEHVSAAADELGEVFDIDIGL